MVPSMRITKSAFHPMAITTVPWIGSADEVCGVTDKDVAAARKRADRLEQKELISVWRWN